MWNPTAKVSPLIRRGVSLETALKVARRGLKGVVSGAEMYSGFTRTVGTETAHAIGGVCSSVHGLVHGSAHACVHASARLAACAATSSSDARWDSRTRVATAINDA